MKCKGRIIFRFIILFLLFACEKEQETIILDKQYLTVADLLEYCKGSCDVIQSWENQTALVKGHIMDFDSDSVIQEYYNKSRFYLQDIRNGMYMEVRVQDSKEAIFNIIMSGKKTDLFYIEGTATAVIANNDGECHKGVVVLLDQPNNIYFENQ
ncbi:MAG: hypothetical protein JW731_02365 [Bacteroidales bacterium]|nr:hypothetical protein [Bacteroidales bacterium]